MEVDFNKFKAQCNNTDEFDGDAICMIIDTSDEVIINDNEEISLLCNEDNCPFNKNKSTISPIPGRFNIFKGVSMLKIIEKHGEGGNGEGANYNIKAVRDGKTIASFYAGPLQECPEDASLERDLSYAYDAIKFFKLGYEAGKAREEIIFEETTEDEE